MVWALLLAATDPAPAPTDAAFLYPAVSAVLVALIGGVVTVLITFKRNSPAPAEPPPARLVDEPSTHALPREMAEMIVTVIAERDVWRNRAIRLGWSDEDGDQ